MKRTTRDGFTCECGTFHAFTTYVYAHSLVELIHTCECGRKHIIRNYEAELLQPQTKEGREG